MKSSKVVLADDHDLFREGIKSLLKKMKQITLAGEAKTGREAIDLCTEIQPDVAILDIAMPDMSGIEATAEIRKRNAGAKIIILSMHDDEDYVTSCLNAGVMGYVVKSESGIELKNTLESVLRGNKHFSNRIQEVIINKVKSDSIQRRTPGKNTSIITYREEEVLSLLVQGLTSLEIAEKLYISIRTVETHRANLMRKLDVKNAIELVKKAMQLKLINN